MPVPQERGPLWPSHGRHWRLSSHAKRPSGVSGEVPGNCCEQPATYGCWAEIWFWNLFFFVFCVFCCCVIFVSRHYINGSVRHDFEFRKLKGCICMFVCCCGIQSHQSGLLSQYDHSNSTLELGVCQHWSAWVFMAYWKCRWIPVLFCPWIPT